MFCAHGSSPHALQSAQAPGPAAAGGGRVAQSPDDSVSGAAMSCLAALTFRLAQFIAAAHRNVLISLGSLVIAIAGVAFVTL